MILVVMVVLVIVMLVIVVLVMVTLQLRIFASEKACKSHVASAFDFGELKDCGSGDGTEGCFSGEVGFGGYGGGDDSDCCGVGGGSGGDCGFNKKCVTEWRQTQVRIFK